MNNDKKNNSNAKNSKRKPDKNKQNNEENTGNNSTNSKKNFNASPEKCENKEEVKDITSQSHQMDQVTNEIEKVSIEEKNNTTPSAETTSNNLDNQVGCSNINGIANENDHNPRINSQTESNHDGQQSNNIDHNNKQEADPKCDTALNNIDAQFSHTNGFDPNDVKIEYKEYESEIQMVDIMKLIQAELSEPYSIYTYRYFIYNWPKLCFLATHGNEYVGAIVCKLDMHMNLVKRGYIAMLAVKKEYRKLKIGTNLVQRAIDAMLADNADEVVLETEMKNVSALRLYENLGFVRDKRLFRYYLNGVDALRLKLWFN